MATTMERALLGWRPYALLALLCLGLYLPGLVNLPVTDRDEPLYDLRFVTGPVTTAIDTRFAVTPMAVTENTELVSADNSLGQAKRYVRVDLPGRGAHGWRPLPPRRPPCS